MLFCNPMRSVVKIPCYTSTSFCLKFQLILLNKKSSLVSVVKIFMKYKIVQISRKWNVNERWDLWGTSCSLEPRLCWRNQEFNIWRYKCSHSCTSVLYKKLLVWVSMIWLSDYCRSLFICQLYISAVRAFRFVWGFMIVVCCAQEYTVRC